MAKKTTWSDVKQQLTNFDRAGLLGLLKDLYAANKDNQTFLHTRFNLLEENLQPYKKTIVRWICPNFMNGQSFSISKAKKAIRDYKKAVGKTEGIAELYVFYCETCLVFLDGCGVDDEGYFMSLVLMVEQSLKAIKQLEPEHQKPLIQRLSRLRHHHLLYAYGTVDDIEYFMNEYGIHEETKPQDP